MKLNSTLTVVFLVLVIHCCAQNIPHLNQKQLSKKNLISSTVFLANENQSTDNKISDKILEITSKYPTYINISKSKTKKLFDQVLSIDKKFNYELGYFLFKNYEFFTKKQKNEAAKKLSETIKSDQKYFYDLVHLFDLKNFEPFLEEESKTYSYQELLDKFQNGVLLNSRSTDCLKAKTTLVNLRDLNEKETILFIEKCYDIMIEKKNNSNYYMYRIIFYGQILEATIGKLSSHESLVLSADMFSDDDQIIVESDDHYGASNTYQLFIDSVLRFRLQENLYNDILKDYLGSSNNYSKSKLVGFLQKNNLKKQTDK